MQDINGKVEGKSVEDSNIFWKEKNFGKFWY